MDEIHKLGGIDPAKVYETKRGEILSKSNKPGETGFNDYLKGFISEVNDLQLEATGKIEKLASGEIKDMHEVMVAVNEADTSFKIMMEIRNRLMTAYKEIEKMK